MRKVHRRPIEGLEDRKLMAGEKVLFIRGADRSGAGIGQAPTDSDRTEQLSDINNNDTSTGNHGWGQLRSLLQSNGYVVTQLAESVEAGAASTGLVNGSRVNLSGTDLSQYKLIVFGSNNAQNYTTADVDAVDAYVRAGGGALFISDSNWGGSWADASNSDQLFMSRYGWTMNQDQNLGEVTIGSDKFVAPNHPVLTNVSSFKGEGITAITVGGPAKRQANTIVAAFSGNVRQNNGNPGSTRNPTSSDASLVLATVNLGRVGAFMDRNGWFNGNGSGTDLGKASNQTMALNLMSYLAKGTVDAGLRADAVDVIQPEPPPYRSVQVVFNSNLGASVSKDDFVIQRRKDKRVMAGSYWKFSTFLDSQGRTVAQARVTKTDFQGKYQIVVLNGSVAGPSGLALDHTITLRFYLEPLTTGGSVGTTPVSGSVLAATKKTSTAASDLFSDAEVV